MASLFKRRLKSGIAWRIDYRQGGRFISEYLPVGTTQTLAKKILSDFDQRLAESKLTGKQFISPLKEQLDPLTVGEFRQWILKNKTIAIRKGKPVDDRTLEGYDYAFSKLALAVGENERIAALGGRMRDIEKMLLNFSPNSQSIIVRSLRAAWAFGIQRGIVEENPFKQIPVSTERRDPGFWTIKEKDAVQAHLSGEALKGFLLARHAGLRKIEICRNILWEDVYWESGYGLIREAKTGENQRFIIFPALERELRPLAGTGQVCTIHYSTLAHDIQKAKVKAGVTKPGAVKILRHSLAHELLAQGQDIRFVQLVLRHSSITTTTIYTNFRTDEIRNIMSQVKT
ncbi:MAG: tyrosine-type recombinase/integrase [Acidobacteria bacterium]|nr:tyrosine-type recombinase/integrase [Acidobacteriota bacterium]